MDYISRDDALNFEMDIEASPEDIQAISTGMSLMSEYIKQLSSVSIVRCGECRFLTPSSYMPNKGFCCVLNKTRDFNWFCANGKCDDG